MPITEQRHKELMALAIEEMRKSKSEHTDRHDPKVGAVLVDSNGVLLGQSYRGELRKGNHAEFTLFERKYSNKDLTGSVLYTTLEPCVKRNHPKKGCTFWVIDARVSEVVIGHLDPDPGVAGQGAEILEKEGIKVLYFDPEFEEIIAIENAAYFKEKEELAKQVKDAEVVTVSGTFEKDLDNFHLSDFSEDAQSEMVSRMDLKYRIGSAEYNKFLSQFGFIKKSAEADINPRATGLGLLMLGKQPELEFPQERVKFTIHPPQGEPIIRDFSGPLVLMPGKIEEYLELIFSGAINRDQFRRSEVSDFPKKTLREIIINAIVHRDYSITGAKIMVDIYTDRVEVASPGIPKFSLAKFKEFSVPSVSINPKIAYIFNQMKLVEERGLGMKELKLMKEEGNPPDFILSGNIFTTIIYKSKASEILSAAPIRTTFIIDGVEGHKYEDAGLAFINSRGKISVSDYATHFNQSTKTVSRYLNKLVEDGILMREGVNKGTKYSIKSN